MKPEFSGIEKRLERQKECLSKLEPLKDKALEEIEKDPYLPVCNLVTSYYLLS